MEFKSKNVHRELCTDLNRVIIKKNKSLSNISLNTDNVFKSKPPAFPPSKKKKKNHLYKHIQDMSVLQKSNSSLL